MNVREKGLNACVVAFLACFVLGAAVAAGEVRTGAFEAVFGERWPV